MDIIASHQAVKFAREWTTSGKGPLLLEFVTYRYGGHSMSDPGTTYRTREEIQRMRSTQDPIKGLQKYLEEWGVASEEDLKVHYLVSVVLSIMLITRSRLSIRQPRPKLMSPSRRLRLLQNQRLKIFGPTSTSRVPSHRS